MSSCFSNSLNFTPVAASSPKSFLNLMENNNVGEKEIIECTRKKEVFKSHVRMACQLALGSEENKIYYSILPLKQDEENCQPEATEIKRNQPELSALKVDGGDVDEENGESGRTKRRQPERAVKRKCTMKNVLGSNVSAHLVSRSSGLARSSSKLCAQIMDKMSDARNLASTSTGAVRSKSSALKVDTKCDTRNLTPVKRVDYKIASVTPKPNLKSEPSILRKPKAGETVISMTGSPLLVSSFQGPTQIPQLSIPIDQERVLTVLGRESLDVSNFPCVDPLTRARLAKLHNFLGQVLEDKN